MSKKECPACHLIISGEADTCPNCGLKRLNQIFLSRAEYELWVKNTLQPHLESLAPRVFAGYEHVLILTGTGELYGIGKNDCGQLGNPIKEEFSAPHLIAEKVKSAAAGRNYSIYVTNEGGVRLLGNGEYAEKFQGFAHAKEVFAMSENDVFWIKDEDGRLYAFGENSIELVESSTAVEIYKFPLTSIDITYKENERKFAWGTGSSVYSWPTSNGHEKEVDLKNRLKEEEAYNKFKKQYGEKNLDIELGACIDVYLVSGSSLSSGNRTERHFSQPKLMLKNNRIYQPVLSGYEYIKGPFYKACGLIPVNNEWEIPEIDAGNIKKANYSNSNVLKGWLVLRENGELCLSMRVCQKTGEFIVQKKIMDEVSDMSLSYTRLLIAKKSGDLLYGKRDIIEMLNKDDADGKKIEQQMTRFRI